MSLLTNSDRNQAHPHFFQLSPLCRCLCWGQDSSASSWWAAMQPHTCNIPFLDFSFLIHKISFLSILADYTFGYSALSKYLKKLFSFLYHNFLTVWLSSFSPVSQSVPQELRYSLKKNSQKAQRPGWEGWLTIADPGIYTTSLGFYLLFYKHKIPPSSLLFTQKAL